MHQTKRDMLKYWTICAIMLLVSANIACAQSMFDQPDPLDRNASAWQTHVGDDTTSYGSDMWNNDEWYDDGRVNESRETYSPNDYSWGDDNEVSTMNNGNGLGNIDNCRECRSNDGVCCIKNNNGKFTCRNKNSGCTENATPIPVNSGLVFLIMFGAGYGAYKLKGF